MKPLMPQRQFIQKLLRNSLIGLFITILALLIGMVGYRHFEGMPWVDAFENAAMILSGMVPVSELHNAGAKIFAGAYALFSGTLFLVIIAIVMAPIIHRFLHKFHLEEKE